METQTDGDSDSDDGIKITKMKSIHLYDNPYMNDDLINNSITKGNESDISSDDPERYVKDFLKTKVMYIYLQYMWCACDVVILLNPYHYREKVRIMIIWMMMLVKLEQRNIYRTDITQILMNKINKNELILFKRQHMFFIQNPCMIFNSNDVIYFLFCVN